MGGSGGGGTSPGIGGGRPNKIRCGGVFRFIVYINGNEEEVWHSCAVGDEIYINISGDTLPILKVLRVDDNLVIGLVPTEYLYLLACIKDESWKYFGKIEKITGNKFAPEVHVMVKGDK